MFLNGLLRKTLSINQLREQLTWRDIDWSEQSHVILSDNGHVAKTLCGQIYYLRYVHQGQPVNQRCKCCDRVLNRRGLDAYLARNKAIPSWFGGHRDP